MIEDFNRAHDLIDLADPPDLTRFDRLERTDTAQDAPMTIGSNAIVLQDLASASLTSDNAVVLGEITKGAGPSQAVCHAGRLF